MVSCRARRNRNTPLKSKTKGNWLCFGKNSAAVKDGARSSSNSRTSTPEWNATNEEDGRSQQRPSAVDPTPTVLLKNSTYPINVAETQALAMTTSWTRSADIDISVILLDTDFKPIETVWFKKPSSDCNSIVHCGDSQDQKNVENVRETLHINLKTIPINVHHIVVVASVFTYDISFSDIQKLNMCVNDRMTSRCLCTFEPTEMSGQSIMMTQLTRQREKWILKALGVPSTGRCATQLLRNPANFHCVKCLPSAESESKQIAVRVVGAEDLTPRKDVGRFRPNSNSLNSYYKISYGDKSHTSKVQKRTRFPTWNERPFHLGSVLDYETEKLKIELYDGREFLGMIVIAVNELYTTTTQGLISRKLGPSVNENVSNERVSGSLQIQVIEQEEIEKERPKNLRTRISCLRGIRNNQSA